MHLKESRFRTLQCPSQGWDVPAVTKLLLLPAEQERLVQVQEEHRPGHALPGEASAQEPAVPPCQPGPYLPLADLQRDEQRAALSKAQTFAGNLAFVRCQILC